MQNKLLRKKKKPADNLESIRKKIDRIDDQILSLLIERSRQALAVWSAKTAVQGEKARKLRNVEREQAILDRLVKKDIAPLDAEAVKKIFKVIMAEHLKLQRAYSREL